MKRSSSVITAAAAAALLTVSACSSANTEAEGEAEVEDTTAVTYASFISPTTIRQVPAAEELGYFEDEGIDLEIEVLQTTSGIATLLASGEAQFAVVSYQPALSALAAGVDLRALATDQVVQEGMHTVWTREDSGIDSLEDIEGKRFGLAAVGGFQEVLVREAMTESGLDPDTVTFVEIPQPETEAALEAGDIDAAHLVASFAAGLRLNPDTPLVSIYDFNETESLSGMPVGGLWTSGEFMDENPEVVEGFMSAVERTVEELESDAELDNELFAELGNLSPELVEEMPVQSWEGEATPEHLQRVADLMNKHGMLEEGSVDVDNAFG